MFLSVSTYETSCIKLQVPYSTLFLASDPNKNVYKLSIVAWIHPPFSFMHLLFST